VLKRLTCLGLLGLALPGESFGYATFPDNPIAIGNCTAKVKVTAARLRSGPSLDAKILGVRLSGDTAYMAAYLLSFPYNEILEQWKRETPAPTVGKKAKVKWASVNYRKYPSSHSSRLGRFIYGEEVAVLADAGKGWSLVQSRDASGQGVCYGFISNRALAAPDIPDPPDWITPLAKVHRPAAESLEPLNETPSEHLARTVWSPKLFAMELKSRQKSRPFEADALAGGQLAVVQ
jgi:hypothetical protein